MEKRLVNCPKVWQMEDRFVTMLITYGMFQYRRLFNNNRELTGLRFFLAALLSTAMFMLVTTHHDKLALSPFPPFFSSSH